MKDITFLPYDLTCSLPTVNPYQNETKKSYVWNKNHKLLFRVWIKEGKKAESYLRDAWSYSEVKDWLLTTHNLWIDTNSIMYLSVTERSILHKLVIYSTNNNYPELIKAGSNLVTFKTETLALKVGLELVFKHLKL
jgi:hypothetical protein